MAVKRGRSVVRYVRPAARRFGRRAKKTTIPLAVVAGFGPLISDTIYHVKNSGGVATVPHTLAWHLAGINTWDNNQFDMTRLIRGWSPILAGFLAHKAANRLGINRAIAQAGIPLLRI